MVSSFRVGWGFGRRSWFEIIIMLSVGWVFLFLCLSWCGLGWVCLASVVGVSFGIVGWVGGRGGLDGLVGDWVSVDLVVCDVVVVWVVLAFDCGLTGVVLWIRHSVCWGLVGLDGW